MQTPGPSVHATSGVRFNDVTSSAGLAGFRHLSGSLDKDYIIEATGSGCAFFDYDNDGWPDIYLVNGATINALIGGEKAPPAALYHNNHDGTFTEVAAKAGVTNERWGQGVCVGDFDNDGWEDLYVSNFGRNRLYHNNHDGTFTDVAEKAGITVGSWSTGCAFGDYDGDGRLDLFVAGYVAFNLNDLPPSGNGQVAAGEKKDEGKRDTGMGAVYAAGSGYCKYRGQRVMCGPRGLKGAPDHLFHNNGDGTFSESTKQAGVEDKAGYYGFGVAWFDYDDDGWLDLIVANDSRPNYIYHNKGNGKFDDVSYTSGASLDENGREQAHMGVAIGDYDGDGRDDIHITNFADDSNVLYHNEGGGNFTDVTFASGLGEISIPFLGWGTNFFDYDNDGALDLLVANGHVYPVVDTANWGTSYKQRLLLFRNVNGRFYELGSSAGVALNLPRSSRGSAIGDFDNDGDLDILLNNIDDVPTLLRNDGAAQVGHWLAVKLIGDVNRKCPRDAIGATVFCKVGGKTMRAEIASGRGYNSQSDLRAHFGLGVATKIDSLEVRWPNGKAEQYSIKTVDQIITIEQGRGLINEK
ncbi:MAG: CRTAC1 family protein [Chloracidobacterium sp.]|nr:CRTAC1 family protein [Chloracidobacterium sp.]